MSLNIGQIVKSLIGDTNPGESKAIELKVGQIVRGVILQVMDDQEAIVQINGTQVQAKLETPLQPGQATMLQVQPQSANGTLVLKMVDQQSAAFTEDSIKEWVKVIGLPDQKWANDLVREFRREGGVMTRDTAQQFKHAAAALPKGGNLQTWMQAATLASKRGLPMTGATISALQQTLTGKPAHLLLEALEKGIAAWLSSSNQDEQADGSLANGKGQNKDNSGSVNLSSDKATGIEKAVSKGTSNDRSQTNTSNDTARESNTNKVTNNNVWRVSAQNSAVNGDNSESTGVQSEKAIEGLQPQKFTKEAIERLQPQQSTEEAIERLQPQKFAEKAIERLQPQKFAEETIERLQTQQSVSATAVAAGKLLQLLAEGEAYMRTPAQELQQLDATRLAGAQVTDQTLSAVIEDHEPQAAQKTAETSANASANAPQKATETASAHSSVSLPLQAGGSSNWVGQLIKWLGVDHERLLALSTAHDSHMQPEQDNEHTQSSDNKQATQVGEQNQANSHTAHKVPVAITERFSGLPNETGAPITQSHVNSDQVKVTSDNFKSALMTLAAGEDVPPALKEIAQQLVQHITGQQLLLSPERNTSLLTHVTMFIPMQGPDGGQTASVHIQTRRGSKGELDADNCRLLFDLSMKSLGDTLVDVHVVNKIVSLNLWNNHPVIADLLESQRSDLTQALKNAGYQLLTLRSTPLTDRQTESEGGGEKNKGIPPVNWSSKPYKGVDFRA